MMRKRTGTNASEGKGRKINAVVGNFKIYKEKCVRGGGASDCPSLNGTYNFIIPEPKGRGAVPDLSTGKGS